MRIFLAVLISIHGLIHLLGFIKAYNLAEISQLTQNVSRSIGTFWLLSTILFLLSAILFLSHNEYWWASSAAAIIISQILIISSWSDAKYGTIANLIILVPVVIAFLNSLPSSFSSTFEKEASSRISKQHNMPVLTEGDIEKMPAPVQKYIRYTGAIGKPMIQNFRVDFTGLFNIKDRWLDFNSSQYNFFDDPARLFYIKSSLFGVPFDGLHQYIGSNATMKIKIASIIQVADAKGKEMNKGETVTMFNDMCCMAPASLVNNSVIWEEIDSLTVKGIFTNKGQTISAFLYFNPKGELVNFISDDRYMSADGKEYANYRWSTPLKDYKEINGRKVPTYAEAIWHLPDGKELCYGKFKLVDIEYNCGAFKKR